MLNIGKWRRRITTALKLALVGILLFVSSSCTKTAGVVTDVNFHSEGLMVTKCDEMVYWDLGILIMGQGNCRNEVVRK